MVSYSFSVSFKIKNFSNPGNGSISFKLPIHKSQHLSSIFSIPLSSIEEPISHSNFPGEIECSSDYVYTHYCKTKQHPLIPIGFLAIMLCSTAMSTFDFYTKLFNRLLPSGTFPDDWKLSSITPVFKPGDPSLVPNYCPISFHCHPNYIIHLKVFCTVPTIT